MAEEAKDAQVEEEAEASKRRPRRRLQVANSWRINLLHNPKERENMQPMRQ